MVLFAERVELFFKVGLRCGWCGFESCVVRFAAVFEVVCGGGVEGGSAEEEG